MIQVIFATTNENKMKEIREILGNSEMEIYSMKEAGIDLDVVEDGKSFEENAMIKAKAIAEEVKKKNWNGIVLADDSGLEVDYLDKQPGVHSARFMGRDTSYVIKNQAIIDRLNGVEGKERSARFVCAIVAVFPDGRTFTTRGTIEGQIAYKPEGENGFGYDPIVYLPEYQTTTAGISREEKNRISHRGKALRLMREKILEEIGIC